VIAATHRMTHQATQQQKTPQPRGPGGPLELPGKGALKPTAGGEGVGVSVLSALAGPRPSAGQNAEGGPLGDQLLVAHQLIAGVLVGLAAVAGAQVLETELHGGEHGVVVVHRGTADPRILRESEDDGALNHRHLLVSC